MREATLIVALLVCVAVPVRAQDLRPCWGQTVIECRGQTVIAQRVVAAEARPDWHADVSAAILTEAWDRNETHEWLAGVVAGVDRRVWRAVTIRAEGLLVRVQQPRDDAWLRGFTVGTRVRWGRGPWRPHVDVAVGTSHATREVPQRGTRFNYLAVAGAGVERRVGQVRLMLSGRWLHVSNNGREGRDRNPDIQSLGALVGVGW